MKPFLSICIPTYNRANIVYDTVCNVLRSNRQDIEVVVSNNCSTDNTEQLLLNIKDSRFKYFKNTYNNGADNLISVLTYAEGEYLLLMSDEDDVILENIGIYINQLHKIKPAVMVGTVADNRYRYQYMGNIYEEDTYKSLKAFGFGRTYMSGYIYSKAIMKKVAGDLYGTDIKRKFGYGYNFLELARRMAEYGKLVTQEEVITNGRVIGAIDVGTHLDGGICANSPEYKVKNFIDAVNTIADINITSKQKYILLESYKEFVIEYSKSDYIRTVTKKGEYTRRKARESLTDYYKQNEKNVKGLSFYIRLHRNLKKCDEYIAKSGIFRRNYNLIKLIYIFDTFKIVKARFKDLVGFSIQKYALEMK